MHADHANRLRARVASTSPTTARRRLPVGAVLLALVCGCLIGAGAPSAAADAAAPAWWLDVQHGPQNLPPGGRGQYVVQLFNVGDAASSGTVTLTATLPPNVVATSASGGSWACGGTSFPATTVTCLYLNAIGAPGAAFSDRGNARGPLLISVRAADRAPAGTADATVAVSGGGAAPSSVAEPTPISATSAGFGIVPGSFGADLFDARWPGGVPERQAGSHPFEARIDFKLNETLTPNPAAPATSYTEPDGRVRTIETKLPPGLIGNPQATPRCNGAQLIPGNADRGGCPANTQVGSADLQLSNGKLVHGVQETTDLPVFNMVPPPGAVAAFAFAYLGNPVWIRVTLDPADHYAVIATIPYTTELLAVRSARMTLWGVPADPSHDSLRLNPDLANTLGAPFAGADVKPFLALPSLCGVPGAMQVRLDSWEDPGVFTPWATGTPAAMSGCDDPRFRFEPTITVQPEAHTPSTPTGLDVVLAVPQKDDVVADPADLYAQSRADVAIPTPPLRDATVVLPEGMSVSPSSADGLAACSPLQIGLGTNDEPTCPDASKLGTVRIDTPLLPDPLTGSIFLASQDDNPFGSMLALYLVARGPGVIVKLPGKVAPDALTGQLTTTFGDNPPIPFSRLTLHFDGGPRASLVTPPTCGVKTTTAELTAWNLELPVVHRTDSFTIDGNCTKGFDPGFTAGTTNPIAGRDSSLVTRFTRSDGDEELSRIDVSLPQGVLGRIAAVPLCDDGPANAGACSEASRIGTAKVAAGPGSNPFYITDGRVYMTGPYKGAPFGLSIVVHAKAGPLDLGNVVVRAQVQVDRTTAALRVVSDPMPTILAGIPLQVRLVDVTVDRSHFTFNPTSCAEKTSAATITSTSGRTSAKQVRFQVRGCRGLSFRPRLRITVGGRHHTRSRASTSLTAVLRMPKGGANLRGVRVVLPSVLSARLPVVSNACTLDQFHAADCEKARAGTAVVVTPLLRDPLRGSVYFVKNGRPLPDMMVALRGQVDVDLDSKIAIPGGTRLATDFNAIPDVPITTFVLRLVSGRQGPIGVARDLCTPRGRRAAIQVVYRAQNGRVLSRRQPLRILGCPKAKRR